MLHIIVPSNLHLIPVYRDPYLGLPSKAKVRDHIKYSECYLAARHKLVPQCPPLEAEKMSHLLKNSKAENAVIISEKRLKNE